MNKIQLTTWALIVMAILRNSVTQAGNIPAASQFQSYPLNSGEYNGKPSGTFVAYRGKVQIPGALSLRLYFANVSLAAHSFVLITSLKDSGQQHLNSTTISQWQNTSAYFNGDAVEIALYVAPGDLKVSFDLEKVLVGQHTFQSQEMDNLATISNNRVSSSDPAVGRLHDYFDGNGATAWIAANGYLVTAGHISGRWSYDGENGKDFAEQILEFNVPNSNPNGTINPSNPKDQYAISNWSTTFVEFNTTTTGEDWAFFTVYPNSETGLLPLQAQQKYYDVEQNDSATSLAVTGYGTDSGTLNCTQQTATGSDAGSSGELLKYSVYITDASSGSPVIDEATQKVVGIVDDFYNSYFNLGTSMFNTSLWSAMQPITFNNAKVYQYLSDNITTDPNLGRYNGSSFGSLAVGAPITVTTGSPEVFKGDQNIYSGQKYNNWTLNGGSDYDVINPHKFLMLGTNFTSHLNSTYNAGITSYLSELNSSGFPVSFIDPWFINYNDPKYGMRNLGMTGAAPQSVPINSYNLGTTTSYKGVFVNQNQTFSPFQPYYSVSAPLTQPYNNYTWTFSNWSATNGTYFQNAVATTTPVVFGGSGSVITANYKGIHLSNDVTAFTDNSLKKLVETSDGVLHQVYTSAIAGVSHVWYETSTNQGSTWTIMNNGQPLDGGNGGKCPSIAVNNVLINQDGYGVVIVFQQQGAQGGISGSTFTLQLMNFFQHLSNYNTINMTQTLFSEPKDVYSTTSANPNIVWGDASGDFLATWERKNTYQTDTVGINYEYGQLSNNVYTSYGGLPNHVRGTDANSIYASISCNYGATPNSWGYDLAYHLAWEEYVNSTTSHINWCVLIESLSPISIYQYTPDGALFDNITKQSSYVLNVRPSVIALTDTNAMVWWTGDIDGHGTYYNVNAVGTNPSTHSAFSFGGAAVKSVSSNSAGNTSNYYVAYSMNYPSTNWYNRAALGSAFYNFVTLNTTGQDIQLSNGASSSNMYVSSYSPFSLPYYFSTSQSLNAGGLSKENSYQELYIRGISLKRGALGFSYFFEDLVVDGNSIDFIDAPDSADYGIMGNVNKVFVTKPFAITNNSNFSFTEFSGLADSTVAAQVLGPNGYVAYKVELVDNATNAVIGTIRNTTIKSSNAAASSVVPYVLNTSGVGSRIVVVRITHSSNLDSVKTGLMKGYATEKPTAGLAKASVNELILIGLNVVTDYALDQNYPNPFNPATTISYQLPRDGRVTIKIFDVIGREVTTLVDEFKVSGRYAVKFDASHLSSGIYFYSIKSGDFTAVKKMLLLK